MMNEEKVKERVTKEAVEPLGDLWERLAREALEEACDGLRTALENISVALGYTEDKRRKRKLRKFLRKLIDVRWDIEKLKLEV